jgi:lysyl-tRNA synthetase class 2
MNEYEAHRRSKSAAIAELGLNPYAGGIPWRNLHTLAFAIDQCREFADATPDTGNEVCVSGRVMLYRSSGGLVFMTIRDRANDMQIAVSKKRVGDLFWSATQNIDLGDIIQARGRCAKSRTGEPTVWAVSVYVASKALLPPPAKHEGLTDTETRHRRRYQDLYSNPSVTEIFRQRARIIAEIRRFLSVRDFVEVETPLMHPVLGGAAAKPFVTHHNALDIPLYLRVAPELYLKRLLVGGMENVFEIGRNFRNEGISPRHNPEFTMLEAYCAYCDYEGMMTLVEAMITEVAVQCNIGLTPARTSDNDVVTKIDLSRPWRRIGLREIVAEVTGWQFGEPLSDSIILQLHGSADTDTMSPASQQALRELSPARQLVLIYEKLVEPTLTDPTFVTHFPCELMPLAKESAELPGFAEVFELAMDGMEIAPGYTEQNHPDAQRLAMELQGGVDWEFIEALKHGMPPAGGIGIGIDRLVMALLGQNTVRDVILFPLLRPAGYGQGKTGTQTEIR